jgi:hypothetical protein
LSNESVGNVYAQALEAARDDPNRTELANMVHDLPAVVEIGVDNEDEDWQDITLTVGFEELPGVATAHVGSIMRRAGWRFDGATFAYNRIHFVEVGDE